MGIETCNVLLANRPCVCSKCNEVIINGSQYISILHSSGLSEYVCMECMCIVNELEELIVRYASRINKTGSSDGNELKIIYQRILDCIGQYYLRTGIYLDAFGCLDDR